MAVSTQLKMGPLYHSPPKAPEITEQGVGEKVPAVKRFLLYITAELHTRTHSD